MGWLCVIAAKPLFESLSTTGFVLFVTGGPMFTPWVRCSMRGNRSSGRMRCGIYLCWPVACVTFSASFSELSSSSKGWKFRKTSAHWKKERAFSGGAR